MNFNQGEAEATFSSAETHTFSPPLLSAEDLASSLPVPQETFRKRDLRLQRVEVERRHLLMTPRREGAVSPSRIARPGEGTGGKAGPSWLPVTLLQLCEVGLIAFVCGDGGSEARREIRPRP